MCLGAFAIFPAEVRLMIGEDTIFPDGTLSMNHPLLDLSKQFRTESLAIIMAKPKLTIKDAHSLAKFFRALANDPLWSDVPPPACLRFCPFEFVRDIPLWDPETAKHTLTPRAVAAANAAADAALVAKYRTRSRTAAIEQAPRNTEDPDEPRSHRAEDVAPGVYAWRAAFHGPPHGITRLEFDMSTAGFEGSAGVLGEPASRIAQYMSLRLLIRLGSDKDKLECTVEGDDADLLRRVREFMHKLKIEPAEP